MYAKPNFANSNYFFPIFVEKILYRTRLKNGSLITDITVYLTVSISLSSKIACLDIKTVFLQSRLATKLVRLNV